MIATTKTLLSDLMFPEGPRWHDGRLWFTDQHARKIMAVDLDGKAEVIAEIDDLPGGLGWLPDGSLLVVSMKKRQILRLHEGEIDIYADLSKLAPFHCNDMLVDQYGRVYVGNFGYDLHGKEAMKETNLILIDIHRNLHVAAENLVFPNGMAINQREMKLYVAETFASRLTAFEIDQGGLLHNRYTFAQLGKGYPDGICMDANNFIWVACPNLGRVLLLNERGEVMQEVTTCGAPYACALGGENNEVLCICTSETDDPEHAKVRKCGRIEIVKLI